MALLFLRSITLKYLINNYRKDNTKIMVYDVFMRKLGIIITFVHKYKDDTFFPLSVSCDVQLTQHTVILFFTLFLTQCTAIEGQTLKVFFLIKKGRKEKHSQISVINM